MKKKFVILLIIVVCFLISLTLFITYYVPTIQTTRHNRQIEHILYEKAVEFVINETDAKQKYGDNVEAFVSESKMNLATSSKQRFENYEHFISQLNEATIYVVVNKKYCCVVVYSKDQQGDLIVSDWYWDENFSKIYL